MICPREKKQRSYMCGQWRTWYGYHLDNINTRENPQGGQQRGAWAGGEIGNSSFRLAALWERKTQGCWSR